MATIDELRAKYLGETEPSQEGVLGRLSQLKAEKEESDSLKNLREKYGVPEGVKKDVVKGVDREDLRDQAAWSA